MKEKCSDLQSNNYSVKKKEHLVNRRRVFYPPAPLRTTPKNMIPHICALTVFQFTDTLRNIIQHLLFPLHANKWNYTNRT